MSVAYFVVFLLLMAQGFPGRYAVAPCDDEMGSSAYYVIKEEVGGNHTDDDLCQGGGSNNGSKDDDVICGRPRCLKITLV